MTVQDLTNYLRDFIITELHCGRLHSGARLQSIRQTSEETGADHRIVADAYRLLEAEGLVEIRGRSGVYAIEQERLGGILLSETGRWLADVMTDAWKRQIPIATLPDLIRSCTSAMPLRCAFLESNEDHMAAFVDELEPGFGMKVHRAYLRGKGTAAETALALELGPIDLMISTAFHAASARRIAERSSAPLVVVSAHANLGIAIERQLREGELTVVCNDVRFGERIRRVYARDSPALVHVVSTNNKQAIKRLNPNVPVLLTRAAHKTLAGTTLTMLVPHSPTLSLESARELFEVIIRLNLDYVASSTKSSGTSRSRKRVVAR